MDSMSGIKLDKAVEAPAINPEAVSSTPEAIAVEPEKPKDPQEKLAELNTALQTHEVVIAITTTKVNEIRHDLGLTDEITDIPSLDLRKKSVRELQAELLSSKDLLADQMNEEPLTEETPEEYISRFFSGLTRRYIDNDEDIKNHIKSIKPILQDRLYSTWAYQAQTEFVKNEESRRRFLANIRKSELNEDDIPTKDKKTRTLGILEKKLKKATRESAPGDDEKSKTQYYANTNQSRDFFESGKNRDAFSYSSMLFGVPDDFVNTPEGVEYMHDRLDNKNIFLFGGGDSVKDLLMSEEYSPSAVVNFDPYVKTETVGKNINGIYRSESISAADPRIREMIAKGELSKADEIWATYSVPFYLDSPQEISNLINNITGVLAEGGNARISPISIQHKETEAGSFEARKAALMQAVKEITESGDFNVTIFNDTIKIHKIKNKSGKVD